MFTAQQYRDKAQQCDALLAIALFDAPRFALIAVLQFEKDYPVSHKFSVGQKVDLLPRMQRAAAPGQYEVRKLMPVSESDVSDPIYRIKSVDETYERVAQESDLKLSANPA